MMANKDYYMEVCSNCDACQCRDTVSVLILTCGLQLTAHSVAILHCIICKKINDAKSVVMLMVDCVSSGRRELVAY